MRRREFVAFLGGAAVTWPLAARAQQPAMPVVGYLTSRGPDDDPYLLAAFRKGLNDIGYVELRSVAIEYRFAGNQIDRLPALAADLVRRQVSVIVTSGNPAGPAAKAATTTIPIVFALGVDPVSAGLVSSLSRPGGNVTGATTLGTELAPKQLELLRLLVPASKRFALLVNPASINAETLAKNLRAAADGVGLEIDVLQASSERELDTVFAGLSELQAGGLVIGNDSFFISRSTQLAALALRYAVPAMFQYRPFAAAGGLLSYGGSITDTYRAAGEYTGRILKGEKPADLPVQQSTKVELIINLKTAKALGLTVPLSLLGRADEVIE